MLPILEQVVAGDRAILYTGYQVATVVANQNTNKVYTSTSSKCPIPVTTNGFVHRYTAVTSELLELGS